jgi:hypothetical protein
VQELGRRIKRQLLLVDRDGGTLVAVAFCETRGDVEAVDATLNQMSPDPGSGMQRTDAGVFEVALEEAR